MTNPNIDQLEDYIFKLCTKFRTLSVAEHLWTLARDLFKDEGSAHEWVGSLSKGLVPRAEILGL
jgi:hypothetical protein